MNAPFHEREAGASSARVRARSCEGPMGLGDAEASEEQREQRQLLEQLGDCESRHAQQLWGQRNSDEGASKRLKVAVASPKSSPEASPKARPEVGRVIHGADHTELPGADPVVPDGPLLNAYPKKGGSINVDVVKKSTAPARLYVEQGLEAKLDDDQIFMIELFNRYPCYLAIAIWGDQEKYNCKLAADSRSLASTQEKFDNGAKAEAGARGPAERAASPLLACPVPERKLAAFDPGPDGGGPRAAPPPSDAAGRGRSTPPSLPAPLPYPSSLPQVSGKPLPIPRCTPSTGKAPVGRGQRTLRQGRGSGQASCEVTPGPVLRQVSSDPAERASGRSPLGVPANGAAEPKQSVAKEPAAKSDEFNPRNAKDWPKYGFRPLAEELATPRSGCGYACNERIGPPGPGDQLCERKIDLIGNCTKHMIAVADFQRKPSKREVQEGAKGDLPANIGRYTLLYGGPGCAATASASPWTSPRGSATHFDGVPLRGIQHLRIFDRRHMREVGELDYSGKVERRTEYPFWFDSSLEFLFQGLYPKPSGGDDEAMRMYDYMFRYSENAVGLLLDWAKATLGSKEDVDAFFNRVLNVSGRPNDSQSKHALLGKTRIQYMKEILRLLYVTFACDEAEYRREMDAAGQKKYAWPPGC